MTPVINLNKYVYEPIDLCACYEPIFFPPKAQVKEGLLVNMTGRINSWLKENGLVK